MKEAVISPKIEITISKYQADAGGEYFRILVTSDERKNPYDVSKLMWMAVDSGVFYSKEEEKYSFNKAFVEASECIAIRIRGLFRSCDLVKDLEAKEQT